jgi:TatA/E family protein of Tat protein translocase
MLCNPGRARHCSDDLQARLARSILAPGGFVFGPLGVPEIILIFVVALLLFGPRQMPNIGRSIGRALGEFRRASNDFKRTIEDEVSAEDLREVQRDLREVNQVGKDVISGNILEPVEDATEPTSVEEKEEA